MAADVRALAEAYSSEAVDMASFVLRLAKLAGRDATVRAIMARSVRTPLRRGELPQKASAAVMG